MSDRLDLISGGVDHIPYMPEYTRTIPHPGCGSRSTVVVDGSDYSANTKQRSSEVSDLLSFSPRRVCSVKSMQEDAAGTPHHTKCPGVTVKSSVQVIP